MRTLGDLELLAQGELTEAAVHGVLLGEQRFHLCDVRSAHDELELRGVACRARCRSGADCSSPERSTNMVARTIAPVPIQTYVGLVDTKAESPVQGVTGSNDADELRYNSLGMRVWTADEMKLVLSIGELAKPFSLSAALEG